MLEFDEENFKTTIPKFFKPATLLNFDTNLLTISFLQKGILTAIQDLKFEGGELPEGIVQAHLDSIFGILVENEYLGQDGVDRLKKLGSNESQNNLKDTQTSAPKSADTQAHLPREYLPKQSEVKPEENENPNKDSVSSDEDSSEAEAEEQKKPEIIQNGLTADSTQEIGSQETEKKSDDLPKVAIFRDETTQAQRELYESKNRLIAQVDGLLDEEQKRLSHQATFYFGDNNYFRDYFIMNKCKSNKYNGKLAILFLLTVLAMPIRVLLSFNYIKKITQDHDELYEALRKFENSPMCNYELLHEERLIRKKGLKTNPPYP